MPITTLSSREFSQNPAYAKKAAENGPVYITCRGTPTHVLLTIADYRRLNGEKRSIVDILAMPGLDFEVEFPRIQSLPRVAEFD